MQSRGVHTYCSSRASREFSNIKAIFSTSVSCKANNITGLSVTVGRQADNCRQQYLLAARCSRREKTGHVAKRCNVHSRPLFFRAGQPKSRTVHKSLNKVKLCTVLMGMDSNTTCSVLAVQYLPLILTTQDRDKLESTTVAATQAEPLQAAGLIREHEKKHSRTTTAKKSPTCPAPFQRSASSLQCITQSCGISVYLPMRQKVLCIDIADCDLQLLPSVCRASATYKSWGQHTIERTKPTFALKNWGWCSFQTLTRGQGMSLHALDITLVIK